MTGKLSKVQTDTLKVHFNEHHRYQTAEMELLCPREPR